MSVSVVIPVYNCAATLAETLASVQNQTVPPLEIICVDDGSDDESFHILQAYKSKRPLTIIQQKNAGVSAARNAGIAAAKGDYIAFLDADDIWLPQKIEKSMAAIQAQQATFLVHNVVQFWPDGTEKTSAALSRLTHGKPAFVQVYLGNCITTSAVVLETKTLKTVGGFDETLPVAEDLDLWLKVLSQPQHKICVWEEPLTHYRMTQTGLSSHPLALAQSMAILAARYARPTASIMHKPVYVWALYKWALIHRDSVVLSWRKQTYGQGLAIIALAPWHLIKIIKGSMKQ